MSANKKVFSYLGLFYCPIVWGATFFMVKDAIVSVDPVALVAYRFLLSAALLLPWVALKKNPAAYLKDGAVLSLWLVLLYLTQTIGLKYTTAVNSGFITGLFILFVPPMLWMFFDQEPTWSQWLAVLVAACGLWLLTGGLSEFNLGDGLTLLTALAYAAHLLMIDKKMKRETDTVLLAFHQFWVTGLICLAAAVIFGLPLSVHGRRAFEVISFLAVFPSFLAFFIQMVAQKHIPAVQVSLIFSLEPVCAALFAWTAGGESFNRAKGIGGGLIVAAMVASELSKLTLLRSRKKELLAA